MLEISWIVKHPLTVCPPGVLSRLTTRHEYAGTTSRKSLYPGRQIHPVSRFQLPASSVDTVPLDTAVLVVFSVLHVVTAKPPSPDITFTADLVVPPKPRR